MTAPAGRFGRARAETSSPKRERRGGALTKRNRRLAGHPSLTLTRTKDRIRRNPPRRNSQSNPLREPKIVYGETAGDTKCPNAEPQPSPSQKGVGGGARSYWAGASPAWAQLPWIAYLGAVNF